MTFEPPDPTDFWQSQSTDNENVSIQQLQRNARKRNAKARRELLMSGMAGLVFVPLCVAGMIAARGTLPRIIWAVAAVILLGGLAREFAAIRRLHGTFWVPALPQDVAATACVDFYQRELQRQLGNRSPAIWFVMTGVAAFVLILVAIRGNNNGLPWKVALPVGLLLLLIVRKREERKVRLEIDALNALRGKTGTSRD